MSSHAMPPIWIVADIKGPLRAEVDQNMLGPFAYSKRESALAAASDPGTLLAQAEGELSVQELDGVCFLQDVLNSFSAQDSDVLILDEGLYPLSPSGAAWVDAFRSTGEWVPVFQDENPETRINTVLERISHALGIGTIRVAAEEGSRIQECHRLIKENVSLQMNPESPKGTKDGYLQGDTTFWVYTTGMAKFQRPELEMRGVPAYFVRTAGASLQAWAAFSIDNEIEAGQVLKDGGSTLSVSLVAVPSGDPYWNDKNGCLRLAVWKVMVPFGGHDCPTYH